MILAGRPASHQTSNVPLARITETSANAPLVAFHKTLLRKQSLTSPCNKGLLLLNKLQNHLQCFARRAHRDLAWRRASQKKFNALAHGKTRNSGSAGHVAFQVQVTVTMTRSTPCMGYGEVSVNNRPHLQPLFQQISILTGPLGQILYQLDLAS